jgi:hypothetical protein
MLSAQLLVLFLLVTLISGMGFVDLSRQWGQAESIAVFFCLIILAYSLCRLWRRTFYPFPGHSPRDGGPLQAPHLPSAQACPNKIQSAPKEKTKEMTEKKTRRRTTQPAPTLRLQKPCRRAWEGTVVVPHPGIQLLSLHPPLFFPLQCST